MDRRGQQSVCAGYPGPNFAPSSSAFIVTNVAPQNSVRHAHHCRFLRLRPETGPGPASSLCDADSLPPATHRSCVFYDSVDGAPIAQAMGSGRAWEIVTLQQHFAKPQCSSRSKIAQTPLGCRHLKPIPREASPFHPTRTRSKERLVEEPLNLAGY